MLSLIKNSLRTQMNINLWYWQPQPGKAVGNLSNPQTLILQLKLLFHFGLLWYHKHKHLHFCGLLTHRPELKIKVIPFLYLSALGSTRTSPKSDDSDNSEICFQLAMVMSSDQKGHFGSLWPIFNFDSCLYFQLITWKSPQTTTNPPVSTPCLQHKHVRQNDTLF